MFIHPPRAFCDQTLRLNNTISRFKNDGKAQNCKTKVKRPEKRYHRFMSKMRNNWQDFDYRSDWQ